MTSVRTVLTDVIIMLRLSPRKTKGFSNPWNSGSGPCRPGVMLPVAVFGVRSHSDAVQTLLGCRMLLLRAARLSVYSHAVPVPSVSVWP